MADSMGAHRAAGGSGAELEGRSWRLVDQAGPDGTRLAATSRGALRFEGGRLTGTTGCNRITSNYTLDGDALRIERGATTKMACPGPPMAQESALLDNLPRVKRYEASADALTLLDEGGASILQFAFEAPRPLVGTRWEATNINNGRGGVENVREGTSVTAEFRDDGRFGGSAGCNSYGGKYTATGDSLQLSEAVSTRKMCLEPDGVMEQESAFLALLTTVARFRIDNDVLELRTADGALAARFQAGDSTSPR